MSSYDDTNTPRYRLLAPCYLEDDTLHEEGEEIYYLGTPNEEMEPMNDLARDRSRAYLEGLDDHARAVAASRNLPFLGRSAMMDQAFEHAHRTAAQKGPTVLPASREDVPLRGDLATPAQRAKREMREGGKKVLGTKAAPRNRARQGSPPVLGIQPPGPNTPIT